MLARMIFMIAMSLAISGLSSAQSMMSGGAPSPDGGRPQSTRVGFFEFLESGGDALLGVFKPPQQQYTVESPQYDSLESPRQMVMMFVEAMNHVAQGRTDAWPRALRTMPGDVGDPKATARSLLQVFDRLPELSPGMLPGKDIVDTRRITRFELFPRGIDSDWLYTALDEPPAGVIEVVQKEGRWLFSDATLLGASELASSIKAVPPRPRIERRGALFRSVVEPTFEKTRAKDWAMAAVYLVAGFSLAWGLYWVLQRVIGYLSKKEDPFVTPILTSVLYPAVILVAVLGVAVGTAQIHMHPTLSNFRWKVIEAALLIAGIYLLVSLFEIACLGIRRTFYGDKDPYAKMMALVIRRGMRVIATIVLILFVFQNVFQWNVTALIGGFGIIALALSLAAQDAVKNLFGALTIFGNRPFINGDWIKFEGHVGTVEDVSLQVTRVRLLSGEVLSIPNMKFIDNQVENMSMRKYVRRIFNAQITYDTPPEKVNEAIEILETILRSDDVVSDGRGNMDEHPPKVWFEKFGPHFLNIRADYWYLMQVDDNAIQRDTERGYFSYLDHATIVNKKVLSRFNDAAIEFAFPTQSLYLASDPQRQLEVKVDHQTMIAGDIEG